jgi:hypothetical protein
MKTIVFTLYFLNSFGTQVIPSIGFFKIKIIEKFFLNHKKSKVGCCSCGWLGRWVVKRTIQQYEMKSKMQLHDRPKLIHAQIKLDVITL